MKEAIVLSLLFSIVGLSSANADPFRDFMSAGHSLQDLSVQDAVLPEAVVNTADKNVFRVDPRILGGNSVDISDYPWQVALIRGYAKDPLRSQFCGGSLIAPNVVVTAAHCIDNAIVRKDATRIDVIAGTAFYASDGERLKVASIIIHPQWNPTNQDYDIAVLKLKSSSVLGKPIPLYTSPIKTLDHAWVSGWGALFEGGSSSPDLVAADVPVITSSVCNQEASYKGNVTLRMMCAGKRDGGLDSCQGDSGGPLVANFDGKQQLIGIVSWGEGCARRDKYGVYTRISEMVPWITSLVGDKLANSSNNQMVSFNSFR